MTVLDRASEIGVPRPRPGDLRAAGARRAFRHLALDVHGLLPVDPVAVANQQGDWRACRPPMAHAGDDLGAITFDLHPPAATVAALASAKLGVQRVDIEFETRGHPVEGHHECLAVRLTRGEKSQHPSSILYEEIAHFPARGARSPRRTARARGCMAEGMTRLLHDRYYAYAADHAWDLATGESVPIAELAMTSSAADSAPVVEPLDRNAGSRPRR